MINFNSKQFDVYLPQITKDEYCQEKVTYAQTADRTAAVSLFQYELNAFEADNPKYLEVTFIATTSDLEIGLNYKISSAGKDFVVVDSLVINHTNRLLLKVLD